MQLDLFPIGWDLILEYIIGVASIGSALATGIDAFTGENCINPHLRRYVLNQNGIILSSLDPIQNFKIDKTFVLLNFTSII